MLDKSRNRGDGQALWIDGGYLVPGNRRGYLRSDPGPNLVGPKDRLMGSVLVEIKKDPLPSLFLPPLASDQLWASPLHFSGQGDRRVSYAVAVPKGLQANPDVEALTARRLGVGNDAQFVEHGLHFEGRCTDIVKIRARRGVEVDPHLIGVGGFVDTGGPHMKTQTTHVDSPHDVCQISGNQGIGSSAVRCAHDGSLQPVRCSGGHTLLEERFTASTVRVTLHHQRTSSNSPHHRIFQCQVVLNEI